VRAELAELPALREQVKAMSEALKSAQQRLHGVGMLGGAVLIERGPERTESK
jgi:hypothetical protein